MDFKDLLRRKREVWKHVDRIQKYMNNPDSYVWDLDFINEIEDPKVLRGIISMLASKGWNECYKQRSGLQ